MLQTICNAMIVPIAEIATFWLQFSVTVGVNAKLTAIIVPEFHAFLPRLWPSSTSPSVLPQLLPERPKFLSGHPFITSRFSNTYNFKSMKISPRYATTSMAYLSLHSMMSKNQEISRNNDPRFLYPPPTTNV